MDVIKRTDARVRKRCREVYGNDWFTVDKKQRQDEAIAYLNHSTGPVSSSPSEESALRAAIVSATPEFKIVALRPISNASMRMCFEALKGRLHKAGERAFLFHGTSKEVAEKIATDGFNRSFCGQHGTAFGKGVYFASDIRYSLQATYSPVDSEGVKHIIAARVLIGNPAVGDRSMVEPPLGHDSTINCASHPSIFVVYKDFQALPEFLISLTRS